MVSLITTAFLNKLQSDFKDYFNIFFKYENYITDIKSQIPRNIDFEKYRSEITNQDSNFVIGLYFRGPIEISQEYGNKINFNVFSTDKTDKTQFRLTDFKPIKYNINIKFISNDLGFIELIENILLFKYNPTNNFTLTLEEENFIDPINLNYTIFYTNFQQIEYTNEDYPYWSFDTEFEILGFILSYESKLYPKLYKIKTNIKDNQNNNLLTKEKDASKFDSNMNPTNYTIK